VVGCTPLWFWSKRNQAIIDLDFVVEICCQQGAQWHSTDRLLSSTSRPTTTCQSFQTVDLFECERWISGYPRQICRL
jgi:hypothetical protein